MPIITPSYPAMNSSSQVTKFSLQIMVDEFLRGYYIFEFVEPNNFNEKLNLLIEKRIFYIEYNHFLMIEIKTNEESFVGFIESRLNKLVKKLGNDQPLSKIHLNPTKEFNNETSSCYYFIGFEVDMEQMESSELELGFTIEPFKKMELSNKITTIKAEENCIIDYIKFKDIPDFICDKNGGKIKLKQLRKSFVEKTKLMVNLFLFLFKK